MAADLEHDASRAREQFLEGDFAGALALTEAVDRTFLAGPCFQAFPEDWDAWADAQLTRALALKRLGRDDEARAVVRALLVVRPGHQADAGFVPPKVVAEVNRAREELLAGPTTPLTLRVGAVDGAPPAAPILLDGNPVGPGVIDVIPGKHHIAWGSDRRTLDVTAPLEVVLGARPLSAGGGGGETPPGSSSETDESPGPLFWVGVGVGGAALVGATIATIVLLTRPQAPNPGGITIAVDASLLDRR